MTKKRITSSQKKNLMARVYRFNKKVPDFQRLPIAPKHIQGRESYKLINDLVTSANVAFSRRADKRVNLIDDKPGFRKTLQQAYKNAQRYENKEVKEHYGEQNVKEGRFAPQPAPIERMAAKGKVSVAYEDATKPARKNQSKEAKNQFKAQMLSEDWGTLSPEIQRILKNMSWEDFQKFLTEEYYPGLFSPYVKANFDISDLLKNRADGVFSGDPIVLALLNFAADYPHVMRETGAKNWKDLGNV